MAVTFECKTTIEASKPAVFDLSLSVDAHLESMAGSKERAIAGITTGSIGLGEEVTWRGRPLRAPVPDDQQGHRAGETDEVR